MKKHLQQAISQLSQGSVLVVGDIAIDEMTYGTTERLSREAPVLILGHEKTDIILGAAGNAAHNIAKLGAKQTAIIAVTGKDYYCSLLLDAMERDGVDTKGLVQDNNRPTTTKTRISGIANHSVTQQIVRIDRESRALISGEVEAQVLENIATLAPQFDAILLSDYGLGLVSDAVIEQCCKIARQHNKILAVDSHRDLALFQGATVLTPNQPEAENNVGYALDDDKSVLKGGQDLLKKTNAKNVLITRGGSGMSLFEADTPETDQLSYTHIPVFNKSNVFDVTGAGDTVVGTLTLALATGTPIQYAATLGNLAASLVVRQFGAATTSPQELLEALNSLSDETLANIQQEALSVKS